MGVGFPVDGSVLKICTRASTKGEDAPAKPVEYAKKVILVRFQEGPAGTTKSSASVREAVTLAPNPSPLLVPGNSLRGFPAGAAGLVPPGVAPVDG